MSQTVLKHLDAGVLTLTLNRPEVLNAYNRELHNALLAAFDEADANDEVRAIILTGAGRGFSAGNDLKVQAEGKRGPMPRTGFGGLHLRFDLDKPLIARFLPAWMRQRVGYPGLMRPQWLIALIVRTRRWSIASRPGTLLLWLTVGTSVVGMLVPLLPFAGELGFVPLTPTWYLAIVGIIAAYAISAEGLKWWMFRRPGRQAVRMA